MSSTLEDKKLLDSKLKYDTLDESLKEHMENLAEAEDDLRERKAKESQARMEHEDTEGKLFKAKKEIELLSGVSEKIERITSQIRSVDRELQGLHTVSRPG